MALENEKDTGSELSLDEKMHKAITARLERNNEKILSEMTARMESVFSKYSPSVAKTETVVDKTQVPAANDEVAKLRADLEKERSANAEKMKAQLKKQTLSALRSELKGKVLPDLEDVVADWMFEAKKMVDLSEEDAFVKIGEEKFSLQDGVKKFLSLKEAKRFVPAQEAAKRPLASNDRPAPNGGNPFNAGLNGASGKTQVSASEVMADLGIKPAF